MNQIHTLFSIRNQFRNELESIYSIPEIDSIFKLIVQSVMNLSPSGMMAQMSESIDPAFTERMLIYLPRLKQNEPVQYLLGEAEFYGLTFVVNRNVLIPRQESEELIQWILQENRNQSGRILDLGTGSGCLIISLKKHLPHCTAEAWDKSIPALEIAKTNAEKHSLVVDFKAIDLLKNLEYQSHPFDIIVSNPPYVRESEKQVMQKNVLDYEPEQALFVSDADPLLFYRRILELTRELLKPGGMVYFEINENLGIEMIRLMEQFGFIHLELRKDLNGKDRMIRGQKAN